MIPEDHKEHDKLAEQTIIKHVEEYGWHIAYFDSNGYAPTFAYTIGLYKTFKHPEIISFGLNTDILVWMLNHAGGRIKNDEKIETNKLYDGFLEGYPVQFLEVQRESYSEYFGYGSWFYDWHDFPALQLVWPDKESKFPWEEGFNKDLKSLQKLLDRDTHFKFYEPKNLGVYTTRRVIEDKYPILYVHHEKDGDWQFLCGTTNESEDCKLVCLEDIVKLDPTINALFDLPYGWKAERKMVLDMWDRAEAD